MKKALTIAGILTLSIISTPILSWELFVNDLQLRVRDLENEVRRLEERVQNIESILERSAGG